jgi:hypothetical protein
LVDIIAIVKNEDITAVQAGVAKRNLNGSDVLASSLDLEQAGSVGSTLNVAEAAVNTFIDEDTKNKRLYLQ